jgi:hypothetical protein
VTKAKAKNEVHGALMRRLIAKPKVSDLFGKAGRRWLAELELPPAERELAAQAEVASKRTVAEWQRVQAARQKAERASETGAGATSGAHLEVTQRGQAARRAQTPGLAL